MTLIKKIEKDKLMVAVRTDTAEKAYQAAKACIQGGITLVEITFSVPDADQVIKKLRSENTSSIGAGTVLSITEAKKAVKAGATYIVSPHLDEKIVKFTKKEGLVSIPGACTPTEIYRAYKSGGDVIKLFPFVEIGGLDFLKVVRGPLPFIRYLLCGGVNLENVSQYLSAKPSCILVGSSILNKRLIEQEDWNAIAELSRLFVKKIQSELQSERYRT